VSRHLGSFFKGFFLRFVFVSKQKLRQKRNDVGG
jgi:hypothetical protein